MNEKQLIDHLVRELRPVQRLADAAQRAATWFVLAIAYALAVSALLGIRPDAAELLTRPTFVVESAALLVAAGGAALWAFHRSIPGRPTRAFRLVVAFAAALWLGSVLSHPSPDAVLAGWTCVARIAALGVIPALVGIRLLRRARPLEPRTLYRLGALAAGAIAMVGTQLICARDGADTSCSGTRCPSRSPRC